MEGTNPKRHQLQCSHVCSRLSGAIDPDCWFECQIAAHCKKFLSKLIPLAAEPVSSNKFLAICSSSNQCQNSKVQPITSRTKRKWTRSGPWPRSWFFWLVIYRTQFHRKPALSFFLIRFYHCVSRGLHYKLVNGLSYSERNQLERYKLDFIE